MSFHAFNCPLSSNIHDALNAIHDIRQHWFAFGVQVDVRGNPVIYLYTCVIAPEILLLRHRIDVSVYLFNVLEIGGINERIAWKSFIDPISAPVIDRQTTSRKRLPNLLSAIVIISRIFDR